MGSADPRIAVFLVRDSVLQVSSGIRGYSAVSVSIALGAVVWRGKSLGMRAGGAIGGVALTMLRQSALSLTPVPLHTWPVPLSLWTIIRVVFRREAGPSTSIVEVCPTSQ